MVATLEPNIVRDVQSPSPEGAILGISVLNAERHCSPFYARKKHKRMRAYLSLALKVLHTRHDDDDV